MSLEAEEIDSPFGVDFFTWIPVNDHTPPTMDQLEFGVSTLTKLIQMNKKIYVHCKHGHGRAPTMVAAYFISEGAEVSEAVARIKEKRPVIHLEESQVKALGEFKKTV